MLHTDTMNLVIVNEKMFEVVAAAEMFGADGKT